MSAFDWHPRHHRAALDGMAVLTLEERGAYNTLLDLIYERGAPVRDDDRWLSGWMGVSVRKWLSIRAQLISKGKISVCQLQDGDGLTNSRAEIEIENQSNRSRVNVENGASGGRKRAEKQTGSNENNNLGLAGLEAGLKLETETEIKGSVEDKSSTAQVIELDPDKDAWDQGTKLLMARAEMTEKSAKAFFGGLLRGGLKPRELLPAIGSAKANQTLAPREYLTKAAQGVLRRRDEPKVERRVGFV